MSNGSLTRHHIAGVFAAWLSRKLGSEPKLSRAAQKAYPEPRDPIQPLQAVPQRSRVLADVDVLNSAGRYAESLITLKRALETFPGDKDLLLSLIHI